MKITAVVEDVGQVSVELNVWVCPGCGVLYGIPKAFADRLREKGGGYYCPTREPTTEAGRALLAFSSYTLVPTEEVERLRDAASDLYKALVSEHGHDPTGDAPWPACLPVHIAMNRYRATLTEDETDVVTERPLGRVVGEPCRFMDLEQPKPYCAVHGGWWVYGYCDKAPLTEDETGGSL